MSNLNEQQFEQLSMFTTARDLRHNYVSSDYNADAHEGNPENMWEQKHDEAWETGLYHKVANEGVKQPVHLVKNDMGRPEIRDGHHRIAAQYDANPDRLVPVLHEDEDWAV